MKLETAQTAPPAAAKLETPSRPCFIKRLDEISIEDVPSVGGKTASLGEMFRELSPQGVKVPDGFAITAEAYRSFLSTGALDRKIDHLLRGLDTRNLEALRDCGAKVREAILATSFSDALRDEILAAYERLRASGNADAGVAVRSSATAEDLPDASFAGQQETYLNVRGQNALIDACRRCFASLFTDRAISYRADKGFSHRQDRALHRRATHGALGSRRLRRSCSRSIPKPVFAMSC